MRIRMISTAAGPRLPHGLHSGHVYDVSEELAEELIGIRAAEAAPAAAKAEPAVEVAAVDAGEKAITPGTEKKPESLMEQLTKSEAELQADGKVEEPEEDEGDDADESASDDAKAEEGKQASTPRGKKSAKGATKS